VQKKKRVRNNSVFSDLYVTRRITIVNNISITDDNFIFDITI